MTREELQKFIEDESDINQTLTNILNQINTEKSTAVNEERLKTENIQKQLDESEATLKTIKSENADNEELLKQIENLKNSQSELKKEYDSLKIDSAVKLALTKTGAKNVDIAFLALDKDLIKLDKDGEIVGLKEQIDKLKSGEDTSFLFDTAQTPEEPEEPKRQSYSPLKGDKPIPKSQGAELGDKIRARRSSQQEAVKNNIGGDF